MALIEIEIVEKKIVVTDLMEEKFNDEDMMSFDKLSNHLEAKKRAINHLYEAFHYQKMEKMRTSLFVNSNVRCFYLINQKLMNIFLDN